MATTRVFFDVTADGTPLGKIIMEVSVAVSVSSPRYIQQPMSCDRPSPEPAGVVHALSDAIMTWKFCCMQILWKPSFVTLVLDAYDIDCFRKFRI